MRGIVGLDIGHSAVKGVAVGNFGGEVRRVSFLFPSIAIQAVPIADEMEAERAQLETVAINGDQWFFGRTAEVQSVGNYALGLTNSWIESKEHSALFLGAIKKLKIMGMRDVDQSLFVVGLPTNQHAQKKSVLKNILSKLVPGIEIRVAPQPMGALQCDLLAEDGIEHDGRFLADESIAVIEVGYYTTDFLLMQRGTWTERGCDSTGGVRLATERLSKLIFEKHKFEPDLHECQDILISGRVQHFNKWIDVSAEACVAKDMLVGKIVDEADRLFSPVARRLNKVLVAGGGAPLVISGLSSKWPHTEMISDHRMAIADGFCRMGSGILNARARAGVA